MRKFGKILSYIVVAMAASVLTLAVSAPAQQDAYSKLVEMEALILDKFIGETDQTALEDAAAAAMVTSLNDQWSFYMSAEEYNSHMEQMNNAYVGIGITIVVREDNIGFDIRKVEKGSPAEEAGILPGDILIRAEDQEVAGLGTTGTKQVIQGKEGTRVNVTVLRDGKEIPFTVTRRTIDTPPVSAKMLDATTALVSIVNFNSRCAEESIGAIEDMLAQGAQKIVFDVRFNPGGYASELVDLLDYLLPEGELFRTVDYAGNAHVDMSGAACLDIPMAVLVNGDSFSAAEFFAAALREYDAAVVVGQPTTGKGYFQNAYQLSDGSAVNLSIGKYFTPNGVSLADAGGIVPDITVEVDDETYLTIYAGTLQPEEDPQLQAALNALK